MKERYDTYTQFKYFQSGDHGLALLPVPGKLLQVKYLGLYIIEEKISDLNYIVSAPDRRKNTQLSY